MDLVSTLEAEPTGLVEGLVTEELDRGWLLGLGAEQVDLEPEIHHFHRSFMRILQRPGLQLGNRAGKNL